MPPRHLLVTADDFGIGPATSRGILDLAARGVVTSTVLLVTSPFAEECVRLWNDRGRPVELGWHPCLTLDAPILPPGRVPSLVDAIGRFPPLGSFLKRLLLRRLVVAELEAELSAQYDRFLDLVGSPPPNVNGHHHVHVFRPVRDALSRVLSRQTPRPFVRRVAESAGTLLRVPGARVKRAVLSRFGKRVPRAFPGNDRLIGVTDPPFVYDPRFFPRWLRAAAGTLVELTCHPGHLDPTLAGRDGTLTDGQLHRRAAEFDRLSDPSFLDAVAAAGFELVNAEGMARRSVEFSHRSRRLQPV